MLLKRMPSCAVNGKRSPMLSMQGWPFHALQWRPAAKRPPEFFDMFRRSSGQFARAWLRLGPLGYASLWEPLGIPYLSADSLRVI